MARTRTRWTQEEVESFVEWHNRRMAELGYPTEMVKKLVADRDKFLPVPIKSN